MKKIIILLLLFSYLFSKYTDPNGIVFSEVYKLHTTEFVKDGKLKYNTIINNIEFKNSLISFYENGDLKGAYLLKDTIINNITYKADSTIFFHKNSELWIGHIKKHVIVNEIHFKDVIHFNSNGDFQGGVLVKNLLRNNVNYLKDLFLFFNSNYEIIEVRLPRVAKIYYRNYYKTNNLKYTLLDKIKGIIK